MKLPIRSMTGALAVAAAVALCGCDYGDEYPHHRVYERVYDEPGPVVYDYTYYDGGYYQGPYWYYHDRDGRLYHEQREEHEWREDGRRRGNFRETRPPMGVERHAGGQMHHGGAPMHEEGHANGHDERGR